MLRQSAPPLEKLAHYLQLQAHLLHASRAYKLSHALYILAGFCARENVCGCVL